ncbi:MAG: S41 family peptidase [candidate division WOR-3 bacterium]|nr:MAG: S41 family peptidase [candidate division WOR-3 bacterium]
MIQEYVMFSFVCVLLLAAEFCHAQQLSKPEQNFEFLWNEFDERYALFLPRRVDWNLLYKIYRPKVTPQTSDDELFEIMSNMLTQLNDLHVRLDSDNPPRSFRSGKSHEVVMEQFGSVENFLRYFKQRPIDEKYLKTELQERHENIFAYAWLDDHVGYFHFNKFFDVEKSSRAIDEIVSDFMDAKGIIIDVRRNGGGDDCVGKAIADRFADKKRLYMMVQEKNGPGHGDFEEPVEWYVEPGGPTQFTKPVVLLIDFTSGSAAENFALAMRVLPHAKIVGDFTAGCFADAEADKLPNGWYFSLSKNLFRDHNGFCWEGIGVPPDLRVVNTKKDLADGRDRILEFAIQMIE